ncbi:hypothetical protein WR25_20090 [Diploscapter pachys]|uniref:Uncharacterized protein n=1 Tax=Diploscapter pachys TaxID=2018661 RepID=A0A2A2L224_9BILA|nr:hypothetical protein WR25_20090 [Diploscapter pachys]
MDVKSTDSAYYETYNSCQDSNKAIREHRRDLSPSSLEAIMNENRSDTLSGIESLEEDLVESYIEGSADSAADVNSEDELVKTAIEVNKSQELMSDDEDVNIAEIRRKLRESTGKSARSSIGGDFVEHPINPIP